MTFWDAVYIASQWPIPHAPAFNAVVQVALIGLPVMLFLYIRDSRTQG